MTTLDTNEWTVRAWEGVLVQVPPEWDIAAISGDRGQGYMWLDDQENMPRVEVKWQKSSGFVDIESVVDGYLKDLTKKRGKDEPDIETVRDCPVVSKRQMRKADLHCFGWEGELEGRGAAWYCEDCERVMVMQVMTRPEENGERIAREVISRMEDHPRDGWVVWSTYGLQMEVPERFEMSDQKLMAGLIELQFANRGEQIVGARWGMANVALRNKDLKQWARSEIRGYHKKIKLRFEETTFRGHPGLEVSGYFSNPLKHIQSFVMHVMGRPYPEAVRGWVWHCEDENRIYYAGALLDEDHMDVIDRVARSVVCPEGDADESEEPEEPIR
ncbi:MAG: hypothetical protein ACOCX2_07620 [Armatimonadota bacterium]